MRAFSIILILFICLGLLGIVISKYTFDPIMTSYGIELLYLLAYFSKFNLMECFWNFFKKECIQSIMITLVCLNRPFQHS
jgi:hypothetical protein